MSSKWIGRVAAGISAGIVLVAGAALGQAPNEINTGYFGDVAIRLFTLRSAESGSSST